MIGPAFILRIVYGEIDESGVALIGPGSIIHIVYLGMVVKVMASPCVLLAVEVVQRERHKQQPEMEC